MTSDSETRPRKVLLSIDDGDERERFGNLLDASSLELELVDPKVDPLQEPLERMADLLVIRRSEVRPEDLRLVDAYTDRESSPGLVVLSDEGDEGDRARLFAMGASAVLDPSDPEHELRASLEAIAEATGQSGTRSPHAGGREPDARLADFASRNPRMQRFLELVRRVVDTDSSLLITGETGVGKERLARAIHNEGARRDGPFVSVNCGALPEQLLESELFGHELGAFTGASRRKKGRFELADGGTIFLDEIGEMPLHLQVNLLTVLHRRRVQRVGSEETVPVDVRVMAATNRNVLEEVEGGRFREDLYYRLNVVTLDVPSLRERPEDVPDLAGAFIGHFRDALGRRNVTGVSDEALEAMMRFDWPGNVRQLVNAIEHAIVLCRTSQITLADLPESIVGPAPTGDGARAEEPRAAPRPRAEGLLRDEWLDAPLAEARRALTAEFERAYVDGLLARTGGRVGETASLAGISPRALYDKMKRHGLRKEDYP